jgi:hypothetical protein
VSRNRFGPDAGGIGTGEPPASLSQSVNQ